MATAQETFITNMNALANAINTKAGDTGAKTITELKTAVDSIALQKPESQETVTFSGDGQVVLPTSSGYVMAKVTINKPSTLVAGNIKKNVTIAGVTGTYDNQKPESAKTIAAEDLNFLNQSTNTFNPTSGSVFSSVVVTKPTNLAAGNIKAGTVIAGITGTYNNYPATEAPVVNLVMSDGDQVIVATSNKVMTQVTITKPEEFIAANIKNGVTIGGITGTYETPTETKTVTLALGSGNQTVTPSSGKVLSSVTITKPDTLTSGNIKAGVVIAGVTGAYETPTETKTVTFSGNGQEVTPSSGKVLSKVTINKPSTLVAGNIKSGVEIAGITGTYDNQKPESQETVTFTGNGQVVLPTSSGYVMASVTINAPATLTAANIKKGVTIAGVAGTFTASDSTSATAAQIFKGKTAYIDGNKVTGTFTTSNLTATAARILNGYTAYVNGATITGTYKVVSSVTVGSSDLTFSTSEGSTYSVSPGTGNNAMAAVTIEKPANLAASNIKSGVTIAGIQGTYDNQKPEETKTVTLALSNGDQVVNPTSGKVMTKVTITKPSTLLAGNIKAGVTIAGVQGTYNNYPETETKTVAASDLTFTSAAGSTYTVVATSNKVMTQVVINRPTNLEAAYIKHNVAIAGITGSFTSDGTVTNGNQMLSGYIAYSKGTKYTGTIASKAKTDYFPSTSSQSIAAGQYLSGAQNIVAVKITNLSAANVLSGITVKIGDSADDDRIVAVVGTAKTEEQIYAAINTQTFGS